MGVLPSWPSRAQTGCSCKGNPRAGGLRSLSLEGSNAVRKRQTLHLHIALVKTFPSPFHFLHTINLKLLRSVLYMPPNGIQVLCLENTWKEKGETLHPTYSCKTLDTTLHHKWSLTVVNWAWFTNIISMRISFPGWTLPLQRLFSVLSSSHLKHKDFRVLLYT